MQSPLSSDAATLKAAVRRAIDAQQEVIEQIARDVFAAPEVGFREVKTAQLVAEWLTRLGLSCETRLGVTGVKAVLQGGAPGPTVAILRELDSLLVWEHAQHDPITGAAHACGHNAQVAAMIGVCMGLVESGAMSQLAGNVAFMAVPAEEFIEIEDRLRMRSEGQL